MAVSAALADQNRVRTLLALRHGELCVCQISGLLGIASSTISKHLSILFQARLVDTRKDGRWIYYRLPEKPDSVIREALDFTIKSLKHAPEIADDDRELNRIMDMDPVELCKIRKSQ
jgi:DNA-binding transcriptional ArsR family regulator